MPWKNGKTLNLIVDEAPINLDVTISRLSYEAVGAFGDIEYTIELEEATALKVYTVSEKKHPTLGKNSGNPPGNTCQSGIHSNFRGQPVENRQKVLWRKWKWLEKNIRRKRSNYWRGSKTARKAIIWQRSLDLSGLYIKHTIGLRRGVWSWI